MAKKVKQESMSLSNLQVLTYLSVQSTKECISKFFIIIFSLFLLPSVLKTEEWVAAYFSQLVRAVGISFFTILFPYQLYCIKHVDQMILSNF